MARSPKTNIFEFQDYKLFLQAWIQAQPNNGHGQKSRIAKTANCQLAYISQVLAGTAHFSAEQAEALGSLLELTEDEGDFFLLLVQKARAGTPSLRKHYERKLQKILQLRQQLKNRFQDKKSLSQEAQSIYYSHWSYCALHMATLVPQLRSAGAMARYFGLSQEKVMSTLQFLAGYGLVERKESEFFPGQTRIHLEADSLMIAKHHTNWRLQAIRSLDAATSDDLHYSSVVSVSQADFPRVREVLVDAIEQVRAIIKDSKDEKVCSYLIDLFSFGR